MSQTLLGPKDYRVMPWKNGGGTTTELLISPPEASLASGFHWRLSMAEVGVSGPFSRFEGCDRTLLLLEGRGMRLDFAERPSVRLERVLEPVGFSGDWLASGTLLEGPCRDFNVITQRAKYRHRVEVLHLGSRPIPFPQAEICLAFCAVGPTRIGGIELSSSDLLHVEEQSAEVSGPPGAILIAIGIDPVVA